MEQDPEQVIPDRADGGGMITTDNVTALANALGILTMTEALKVQPIPWQVEGLWPEKSLGTVVGPPKIGKSWLSLDQAIAYATGTEHLGRKVIKRGVVVYFLGEDHLADVQERVSMLLAGRGLKLDALGDRLRFSEAALNLEDAAVRQMILSYVQEVKPLLVVFDPLARFLNEADENSAKDLRPVINWWRSDLVRIGKTSVNVVHHTNKGNRSARGTGDFFGMVNVQIMLDGDSGRGSFKVSVTPRRGRAPDPFRVRLVVDGGRATLRADDAPGHAVEAMMPQPTLDRALIEKGRHALRGAISGVSVNQFARSLGIRWDKAKQLLEAIGAVPHGTRWADPELAVRLQQLGKAATHSA